MTPPSILRHLAPLGLTLALAGCGLPFTNRWSTASESEWPAARTTAERHAWAGRHASADTTLATFAQRHPTSREARESLYLRALLQLDPTNRAGSPREAVALLDRYLVDTVAPRTLEASLVRRAATEMDSLSRQVSGLRAAIDAATTRAENATGRDRADSRTDRGREQELQRLREELASTRAELASTKEELDRIKRRLATPRP